MAVIPTPLAPERKDPESLSGFRRLSFEIEKVYMNCNGVPSVPQDFKEAKSSERLCLIKL